MVRVSSGAGGDATAGGSGGRSGLSYVNLAGPVVIPPSDGFATWWWRRWCSNRCHT